MIYPKNFETKIGFDQVRILLKNYCRGAFGERYVDKILFSSNFNRVDKLLRQTDEFLQILSKGQPFPDTGYIDFGEWLKEAKIIGAYLPAQAFHEIKNALYALSSYLSFFASQEGELYPMLRELSSRISFDISILTHIESVIDERGAVKDHASAALKHIRKRLKEQHEYLVMKAEQVLSSLKREDISDREASITVRDGRLVVPVYSVYKRQVKGFIHGISSSGQTTYIEPEAILTLNNEVKALSLEAEQEIIRILSALTDYLRPAINDLCEANNYLGLIDFIGAKARLASALGAALPVLRREPQINWSAAKHPLLLLAYKKQNKAVVSQDVCLNQENRILLISGPNAGGKSVTLKTVALLQYMLQCGLLIPVSVQSENGIFKRIFIDIGDEQSLENDLSTYSSHLYNMKFFLGNAQRETLCLIDEFGTGTEPQFGAAIAEAILSKLKYQQAFAVITTHCANLKFFADNTPGIINAAMRYDVAKLKPLYTLATGQPGSSFALEIAQKIGLPAAIITSAREKIGKQQVNVEKLLTALESERNTLKKQKKRLVEKEEKLEKTTRVYSDLKVFYEKSRKRLLADAQRKAQTLLQEANRRIEYTIRMIKEHKAEKESTGKARAELEQFKQKISLQATEEVAEATDTAIKILSGEPKIGDWVRIKGSEILGEVFSIDKNDALILSGSLQSSIKLKHLEKIDKKTMVLKKLAKQGSSAEYVYEKSQDFKVNIDLRGKKAEEAIPIVQNYISDAIMLGIGRVRIVHGKGEGILRTLIRKQLSAYKEIRIFTDGDPDKGGAGITVVYFN